MLFRNIAYINACGQVVENAYLGTEGAYITYLAEEAPADPERFGRICDGKGKLAVNGFFNAHSHTAMALLRGYGENLPLQEWLHQRIFPFEDHLTYDDIYWANLLGSAEMLRYGIVGTKDMYMNRKGMGDGFRDGGVKANFCIGATCFDGRGYRELTQYTETLAMIDEYHGMDDGRLQVDFSMHAEYTTNEKMARSLAEVAAEHGHGIHIHVSETADEVAGCRERHNGLSPVAYLADCGLFDVPATAAHCVHVDAEDIAILAAKDVTVATCPKSNLKLASGVAPVPAMLKAGVNVALATDSVASNNNLNFIEEMRLFALLHKGVNFDPTLISPAEALHAATAAGAKAMMRPDCGTLAVGNRADIAVLDVTQPEMYPVHNLLNNLVYSADGANVVMTVVDGKVRYENGSWPHLDIEKIYAEVERSRTRILGELAAEK